MPGAATHFQVSGLVAQKIIAGGSGFPSQFLTFTALDQFNNVATGYAGTVRFDGGDFEAREVPPPNSTLTEGRGVFKMNAGELQNDCHYGDIPVPACGNNMRVTATDTVTPSITGYQRFLTAVEVRPTNLYYTPDSTVCGPIPCVVDPDSGLLINNTTGSMTATVIDLSGANVTLQVSGITIAGGEFTQNMVMDSFVGTTGGTLFGSLVMPVVGQGITVLAPVVTGDPSASMSFGNVTVINPTTQQPEVVTTRSIPITVGSPICRIASNSTNNQCAANGG